MADKIIYIRIPEPIINVIDTIVDAKLYNNRAEVIRELLRNGMKSLLYHERGGFCLDLKKMVDCCHDKNCKHKNECANIIV